jgi:hypothetical protein
MIDIIVALLEKICGLKVSNDDKSIESKIVS